jgi:serine/threonine-protein kinase
LNLSSGHRLGPYEILAPLGAGGMGEVYRARDTRLGREVAVKVLPPEVAEDPGRRRRFEQEAQAASALNHPAIITIHDIGQEAGVLYVVFELVEGETLRAALSAGPVSRAKAIDWALQISRGLSAAHERGIVHRDLKPENLIVTRDGRMKILDFGLAKVVPGFGETAGTTAPTLTHATEPGVVLGTIGYLAPEQARGRPADPRSDVFAFGAIVYEMVSGRRAFSGESPADTLTATLRETPRGLEDPDGSFPPDLAPILRRCLEKEPARRFPTARELEFALENLKPAFPASVSNAARTGRRAVAVLPFKSLSRTSEDAHLGVGLADATITELSRIRSLLVRPTAAILRYRDRPVDPQAAGRELEADAVVDGSFQSAGARLRVTVQLIETADGRPLWGTKIDASLEDVFAMQDEVSRRIVEALQVELTPADEHRLAAAALPASPAHELYVKGRVHLFSESHLTEVNAAIECFEKALELDPGSTLAMVGLADAWTRLSFSFDPEGGWYEKAEALCERALALAPELPEGRYLRGRMLWNPRKGFDHAGAMREFAAAIAARPSLGEAHHRMAQVLNHVGLFEEALQAFDQALAIYPDDSITLHVGLTHLLQGRFSKARQLTEAAQSRALSAWGLYQLAHCDLRIGDTAAAMRTVERAAREFPGDVLFLSFRAVLASVEGNAAKAREMAESVVRNRRSFGHYHHALYDLACIHAQLGETKEASDRLRAAASNGFPCLPFFERDPLLAGVRNGAEFQALAADLRAEEERYRELYASLRAVSRDPAAAAP